MEKKFLKKFGIVFSTILGLIGIIWGIFYLARIWFGQNGVFIGFGFILAIMLSLFITVATMDYGD